MFSAAYDGDVLIVEASESCSKKKQPAITNGDFGIQLSDCVSVVFSPRSSLHVKSVRPRKDMKAGEA